MTWRVERGDCVDVMRTLESGSVDAVVCDPPYNLSFMAKPWDCHEGQEDAGFAYWLGGLIDGEGHFAIKAHARGTHAPAFSLKMRADEEGTLRMIHRTLQIGTITVEHREDAANMVRWVVQDKEGCQHLVDLLDKYPLRAKKRIDYLAWREAVCEWTSRPRGNRWSGPASNERMAGLRERLMTTRGYVEPAWSGNEYQDWCRLWAREALRVLKPGGHLLAFGGTRTYHRLAAGIEDAGFEIRDTIAYMYGSGFPKSLNVSAAIDEAAGATRQIVGYKQAGMGSGETFGMLQTEGRNGDADHMVPVTAPSTPEAERWEGWGTALKPAFEPIVVARKPLAGTVAQTVLKHGTGALNIDGCRIGTDERFVGPAGNDGQSPASVAPVNLTGYEGGMVSGRWPANVALGHHPDCDLVGTRRVRTGTAVNHNRAQGPMASWLGTRAAQTGPDKGYAGVDGREEVEEWRCHPDCPVRLLDEQGGKSTSRVGKPRGATSGRGWGMTATGSEYDDAGGASRFFYTSKTSTAEREAGLFDGRICFCERPSSSADESVCPDCGGVIQGAVSAKRNIHPT